MNNLKKQTLESLDNLIEIQNNEQSGGSSSSKLRATEALMGQTLGYMHNITTQMKAKNDRLFDQIGGLENDINKLKKEIEEKEAEIHRLKNLPTQVVATVSAPAPAAAIVDPNDYVLKAAVNNKIIKYDITTLITEVTMSNVIYPENTEYRNLISLYIGPNNNAIANSMNGYMMAKPNIDDINITSKYIFNHTNFKDDNRIITDAAVIAAAFDNTRAAAIATAIRAGGATTTSRVAAAAAIALAAGSATAPPAAIALMNLKVQSLVEGVADSLQVNNFITKTFNQSVNMANAAYDIGIMIGAHQARVTAAREVQLP
jgi:hypothetical protein